MKRCCLSVKSNSGFQSDLCHWCNMGWVEEVCKSLAVGMHKLEGIWCWLCFLCPPFLCFEAEHASLSAVITHLVHLNTLLPTFNSSLQAKNRVLSLPQVTRSARADPYCLCETGHCNQFTAAARRTENLHQTVRLLRIWPLTRITLTPLICSLFLNKRPPVQALPKTYFSHSMAINQ